MKNTIKLKMIDMLMNKTKSIIFKTSLKVISCKKILKLVKVLFLNIELFLTTGKVWMALKEKIYYKKSINNREKRRLIS